MADPKKMIRCTGCQKIIFEAEIKDGYIKYQCKCGTINTIQAEQKPKREDHRPFQYGRVTE